MKVPIAAFATILIAFPAAAQTVTWETRAPLPAANSETAVALAGGKIYVVGGYPSSRETVATVQAYDPKSDTWEIVPPLPKPLNHAMAAGVGGKLYVIGGQEDAGGFGRASTFVNWVYRYDPASRKWSARAPMPSTRSAGAAAVIGAKIYVAGGRPPHGHEFAVYDTEADTWTALPDLPTQRNHLIADAHGGKVYVAGGRFGPGFQSERTAALEVYDPAANSWSSRAAMPRPRGGVNGVFVNGCLHVFGGEGNDKAETGVFPDHDVYDLKADKWTSLAPLPIPVHGVTGAAVADGWVHLAGGGTRIGGSSGSSHHQVFKTEMRCD